MGISVQLKEQKSYVKEPKETNIYTNQKTKEKFVKREKATKKKTVEEKKLTKAKEKEG